MHDSCSSEDMVIGLLKLHGDDLLFTEDGEKVRRYLADYRKIEPPSRMHRGKSSSQKFCETVGLPKQFSGQTYQDNRNALIVESGYVELKGLEHFQVEIVDRVRQLLADKTPHNRGVVCLPTGAGKTVVACRSILEWMTDSWEKRSPEKANMVIWLAQTEELCEQAVKELADTVRAYRRFSPVTILRNWGKFLSETEGAYTGLLSSLSSIETASLIVTTPVGLLNQLTRLTEEFPDVNADFCDEIDLLLIDEAHHSGADSYKDLTSHIEANRSGECPLKVIGLTATPFRSSRNHLDDTSSLEKFFQGNLIRPEESLRRHGYVESAIDPTTFLRGMLQKEGVLAEENHLQLKTYLRIEIKDHEDSAAIEKQYEDQLSVERNIKDRTAIIADEIERTLDGDGQARIIYFGPNVKDAEKMSLELSIRGVKSGFVSGETNLDSRCRETRKAL
jgi:superfamily II DNA or RNA helicase